MARNKHYYAVIFTRQLRSDTLNYTETASKILALARQQAGFIAFNSVEEGEFGIAVSYWQDLVSIEKWRLNAHHLQAQKLGTSNFYSTFSIQICRVERSYDFNSPSYHPQNT